LKLKVSAGVEKPVFPCPSENIQIDFESGVGEAKVSAYEPNAALCEYIRIKTRGQARSYRTRKPHFRELEFEGGVAALHDFTGDGSKAPISA